MGIAKSLRKVNNLSNVRDNILQIGQILENNRKKDEQKQFFENVANAYNNWQKGQAKAENTDYETTGVSQNPFKNIPENAIKPNMGQPRGIGGDMSLLGRLGVNDAPSGEPVIPSTTTTRELSREEKYNKARENLGEFQNKTAPMLLNSDIGPDEIGRLSALGQLAGQQTERLKPKEGEAFNLSAGQKRFVKDPYTGKITEVADNPKSSTNKTNEYEKNSDGSFKLYQIKGQDYYNKIEKDAEGNQIGTTLTRVPKQGEGQTSVNIQLPELNIDQNINKLTQSQNDYKIWDRKSNDTSLSPDERSEAEAQKEIIMGEVKGYTNAIASQMNDKVNGFEEKLNQFYGVLQHNPDKIDSYVDQGIPDASSTTKRYMKMILHARIFGKPPEEK